MSVNNQNSELKDDFIIKHIKMISELYDAETFLHEKIINNKITNANRMFSLFDKDWLEKWKKIVGYEELKNKCKNAEKEELIKDEVRELFIKLNTKQKLEELGKMNCSKLKRKPITKKSDKPMYLDEKSNFIPILDDKCSYFISSIDGKITVKAEISNGIIYIQDPLPEKGVDKKLILLYKENEQSKEFLRPIITLNPKEKIDKVIKELKTKKIEDIIRNLDFKMEILKPSDIQKNSEKEVQSKEVENSQKQREIEDARKKKEMEDAEKKEEMEDARKKKEIEDAAIKKKEIEDAKKKKELEDAKKQKEIEESERQKKLEEEEKKQKELEDKKKKELEEKLRKEEEAKRKIEEEETKRKKELEEQKLRKEEEARKQKKFEEERKKKEEEEKKKKELEEKLRQEEEAKKQKELEEERLKKEEEEAKRKKELEEEKKKKEEEAKKQKKVEEEKKKKEEEEAKRKKELEEEEKKKKEEIEAEKKKKQLQEQEEEKKRLDKLEEEKDKAKKLENEKLGKEKFNEEKNKFQNEVVQNNIADAMKNQLLFEKKVLEKGFSENEEFFCSCSILDKKWFDKFSKLINYDAIKEEVSKSQNNMDDVITKEIKNKNINLKELSELIKEKPKSINAQALENIENLAFVDDEFAAKILNMDLNSMNNNNNQSNNSINQINIKNEPPAKPIIPKANIAINNGAALIQINNQKCIASNLQNGDLNKRQNNEIINLPSENFNLIETIKKIPPKNKKDGLIYNAKQFVFKEKRPNPAPINQISNQPALNNMMNINQPFNNNIQVQNNNQDANKKPRINLDNRDESLGLDNVGATCYMNATLQCLAHVKRVTEHILNYRDEGLLKDTSKFRLSEAYSEVVQEIWLPKNKTKKSFPPDRFKKVLGDMNSLFAPMAANDAKDLLIYFIEQMHTELNKSTETNLNLVMPDNMNPMNHQEVLACFVQEFMKKYNSVFSHYFYGSNVSITLCHGCKIQKFSYQCFSFLIFPLLEAKKNCVAIGKLNPMFYNQYILNIEDCFLYNQKIELFNGNNQMYCNMCQASKDASMWTRISAAPLVLILILNRGKGNLDFKEPFIFWELIDLSNYVEFRQPDNKYFLSGVVSHMGDSGPSGHFIAFCRMSQNSKWYCYNDSIVSESSFIEINKRGTPYILFYQKCVMIA